MREIMQPKVFRGMIGHSYELRVFMARKQGKANPQRSAEKIRNYDLAEWIHGLDDAGFLELYEHFAQTCLPRQ